MTNRIEKTTILNVPIDKAWHVLTDHTAFGEWFRVSLDGPFIVGTLSEGHIAYRGYEHLEWKAFIETLDAPHRFAFTWHPYAVDPAVDYSQETPTRVTFTLEVVPTGTKLSVTETGFNALPADRMAEAFRMNERGWEEQMKNIHAYLDKNKP
ncbi:vanillate O-demethylase oxidoreductase VanB [Paraburkholderia aspalathi]|nr:vanillate O-demethylase oxidoreductase VanB [Paraburkholderia aspalathi]